MKNDDFLFVENLFKEQLDLIKDKSLEDKVVSCWVSALNKGNWKIKDLERIPFTLALNGRKTDITLVEHTKAVTMAAYDMAKAEEKNYGKRRDYIAVNYDYLLAGGILHDVGKLLEIESDDKGYFKKSRSGYALRHPIYGTAIAYAEGIPERVLNAIATHSTEGEGKPRTKESRLVMHADFAFYESIKEPF